jgi:alpha-beta hydrolase superfamily lysophospholipase
MRETTFTIDSDGVALFVHQWLPDEDKPLRGAIQVSHGMAEHSARYRPLAEALTAKGFGVWAHDHRGHGKTAGDVSRRGFFAAKGGWRRVVDDIYLVNAHILKNHPGVPRVLFAHSMGAFMAQQVMFERGDEFKAVVLSASTCGVANPLAPVGRLIARVERARLGASAASPLLTKLSFGEFNKPFRPARTEFDWLSRDPAEVDKYIADPWCGFDVSTQLWIDLLDALPTLSDPQNLARVPKELPIYILAGSEDPVNGKLKGLHRLVKDYNRAGVRDITWRVYTDGRHEMLNETNRHEVLTDLTKWLDRVVPASA